MLNTCNACFVFCRAGALFGLIVAVGLSNLQYVDLNSPRNQFIIGFALFNCLSVAGPGGYFANQDENPFGDSDGATVALAIFSSPMIIAFLCAFILDNLVPGTSEERGMHVWEQVKVRNNTEWVMKFSRDLSQSTPSLSFAACRRQQ